MRSGKTAEGREELQQFQRLQAAALAETQRAYEVNQLKLEAELRVNQGRYEEASRLWQQVVDREPAVVGNVVKAAHALAQAGRHEAAIETLLKALTLNAGLDVHRDLADLYAKVGKTKESEAARATYRHLKEERLRALGNAR